MRETELEKGRSRGKKKEKLDGKRNDDNPRIM